GEHQGQAVGRVPDGTMVVVEHADAHIDEVVTCETTNTVRTNAGNLVFARIKNDFDQSQEQ
ncbi:MAG TPA: hypothetical protein DEQ73_07550, partial [Phycisphaerales bacterium]|nr:hypothetical protein [Phycisphaerales bacterium]